MAMHAFFEPETAAWTSLVLFSCVFAWLAVRFAFQAAKRGLVQLLDRASRDAFGRNPFEPDASGKRATLTVHFSGLKVSCLSMPEGFLDPYLTYFEGTNLQVSEAGLEIQWPRWWIGKPHLHVFVRGLHASIAERDEPLPIDARKFDAKQKRDEAKQRRKLLEYWDRILWNHDPWEATGGKIRPWLKGIIRKGLGIAYDLVSVHIEDVSFSYVRPKNLVTNKGKSFCATLHSVVCGAPSRTVKALEVWNGIQPRWGEQHKFCLSVYGLNLFSVEHGSSRHTRIIRQWWLTAAVLEPPQCHSSFNKKSPLVKVEVNIKSLSVELEAEQVSDLADLIAFIIRINKSSVYYRFRPQSSVKYAPRTWWKYAFCMVCHELGKYRRKQVGLDDLVIRRRKRIEYMNLYMRARHSGFVRRLLGSVNEKLATMEDSLTLEEIAHFRMYAHIRAVSPPFTMRLQRYFRSRNLPMEKIAMVAESLVSRRVRKATKVLPVEVLELSAHCPNITITAGMNDMDAPASELILFSIDYSLNLGEKISMGSAICGLCINCRGLAQVVSSLTDPQFLKVDWVISPANTLECRIAELDVELFPGLLWEVMDFVLSLVRKRQDGKGLHTTLEQSVLESMVNRQLCQIAAPMNHLPHIKASLQGLKVDIVVADSGKRRESVGILQLVCLPLEVSLVYRKVYQKETCTVQTSLEILAKTDIHVSSMKSLGAGQKYCVLGLKNVYYQHGIFADLHPRAPGTHVGCMFVSANCIVLEVSPRNFSWVVALIADVIPAKTSANRKREEMVSDSPLLDNAARDNQHLPFKESTTSSTVPLRRPSGSHFELLFSVQSLKVFVNNEANIDGKDAPSYSASLESAHISVLQGSTGLDLDCQLGYLALNAKNEPSERRLVPLLTAGTQGRGQPSRFRQLAMHFLWQRRWNILKLLSTPTIKLMLATRDGSTKLDCQTNDLHLSLWPEVGGGLASDILRYLENVQVTLRRHGHWQMVRPTEGKHSNGPGSTLQVSKPQSSNELLPETQICVSIANLQCVIQSTYGAPVARVTAYDSKMLLALKKKSTTIGVEVDNLLLREEGSSSMRRFVFQLSSAAKPLTLALCVDEDKPLWMKIDLDQPRMHLAASFIKDAVATGNLVAESVMSALQNSAFIASHKASKNVPSPQPVMDIFIEGAVIIMGSPDKSGPCISVAIPQASLSMPHTCSDEQPCKSYGGESSSGLMSLVLDDFSISVHAQDSQHKLIRPTRIGAVLQQSPESGRAATKMLVDLSLLDISVNEMVLGSALCILSETLSEKQSVHLNQGNASKPSLDNHAALIEEQLSFGLPPWEDLQFEMKLFLRELRLQLVSIERAQEVILLSIHRIAFGVCVSILNNTFISCSMEKLEVCDCSSHGEQKVVPLVRYPYIGLSESKRILSLSCVVLHNGTAAVEIKLSSGLLLWPHASDLTLVDNLLSLFSSVGSQGQHSVESTSNASNTQPNVYINAILEEHRFLVPTSPFQCENWESTGLGIDIGKCRVATFVRKSEIVVRVDAADFCVGLQVSDVWDDIIQPFVFSLELMQAIKMLTIDPDSIFRKDMHLLGYINDASAVDENYTQTVTSMAVNCGDITIHARFSHLPFLLSIEEQVLGLVAEAPKVFQRNGVGQPKTADKTEEALTNYNFHVEAKVKKIEVQLIEDRHEHSNAQALSLLVNSLKLSFLSAVDIEEAVDHGISLSATIALKRNDPFQGELYPFVEPWPVEFHLEQSRDTYKHSIVKAWVHSEEKVSVILSKSLLLCVGDAMAYVKEILDANVDGKVKQAAFIPQSLRVNYHDDPFAGENKYVIQNLTGLRLWYWTDDPKLVYNLAPGKPEKLKVLPARLVVSIRNPLANQYSEQVEAKGISIRFEGNWLPVKNIVVSHVSRQLLYLEAPGKNASLPFVIEVAVVGRTKIISIHSCLWLQNRTDRTLHFRCLSTQSKNLVPYGVLSQSEVPNKFEVGPLHPGQGVYLPIFASVGGELLSRVEGCQFCPRDAIVLGDPEHMESQEGTLSCISARYGTDSSLLYLSMQVNHRNQLEPNQPSFFYSGPSSLTVSDSPIETELSFLPPLIAANGLPYPIKITLTERHGKEYTGSPLGLGNFVEAVRNSDERLDDMKQMSDVTVRDDIHQGEPETSPAPAETLGGSAKSSFTIAPGQAFPLYTSLCKDLYIQVAMYGYLSQDCVINYSRKHSQNKKLPGKVHLTKRHRKTLSGSTSTVDSAELSGSISPPNSPRAAHRPSSEERAIPTLQSIKNIRLELQNQVAGLRSSSRQICLFVSTLIDNRSGHNLLFKQTGVFGGSFTVPASHPGDSNDCFLEPGPFLYDDKKDIMFQVPGSGCSEWSQALNVRKIGARDPVRIKGKSIANTTERGMDGSSRKYVSTTFFYDSETDRVEVALEPCAPAPRVDTFQLTGLYEFTVQVRLLPSSHPQMFGSTRVLTIKSRYSLDNRSGMDIEVVQKGVPQELAFTVRHGQHMTFHWMDCSAPLQLLCRPIDSDCFWSGGLSIDVDEGFYGMSVARKGSQDKLILPVNITSTQHDSRVVFLPIQSTLPPYIVENTCEKVTICLWQAENQRQTSRVGDEPQFSQLDTFVRKVQASGLQSLEGGDDLHLCTVVPPKVRKAFAMHEPLKQHTVEVVGARPHAKERLYSFCPARKYDLDMVADHKPLVFPVEANEFDKDKFISRRVKSMKTMLSTELGKHVYASVSTVGHTRVLRFSDKKNQDAKDEEKSLHALMSRLKKVRHDLQLLSTFLGQVYYSNGTEDQLTLSGRWDTGISATSSSGSLQEAGEGKSLVGKGSQFSTHDRIDVPDSGPVGGNMRVTLVAAEGLQLRSKSFMSNAFVLITAGKQTQQSSVCVGTNSPVWNDSFLFSSVSSEDILLIEVFSKSREGNKFLGHVNITLSETLSGHPLEDKDFVLSRRDADEEVSGNIRLRFEWEVTPHSLLLVRLKATERTLTERLEILSLMRPISTSDWMNAMEERAKNEDHLMPYELGGVTIKLLEVQAGDTSVGVLESSGFATLAKVECNNEEVWAEISSERGTRATKRTFYLNNVPPAAAIRISFYEEGWLRKKLVGYTEIQCLHVQGNCPYYIWLPCKSPFHTLLEEVKVLVGVNWAPYEYTGDQQQFKISLAGLAATVLTPGVGELVNANMKDIDVIVQVRKHEVMVKGSVKSMQVDNQLLGAEEMILVRGSSLSTQLQSSLERQVEEGLVLAEEESLVSFEYTRTIPDRTEEQASRDLIPCFKRLSIKLQELDVAADQQFLQVTIAAFSTLPMDDLFQSKEWQERHARMISELTTPYDIAKVHGLDWETPADAVLSPPQNPFTILHDMDMAELVAMHGYSWTSSWMFLQSAVLGDIRVNVTLALSSSFLHMQKDKSRIQTFTFGRMAEKSGFQLVNLNNAHIYLRGIEFRNQLLGKQQLQEKLLRHYLFQGLTQIHKVLTGAGPSILQAPLSAVYCVGSLSSLMAEAYKGEKKKASVVPYVFFIGGTTGAQFCGALSRSLVGCMKLVSFSQSGALGDDETLQRYSKRTVYGRQAFYRGNRELVYGVLRGGYGLIMDPFNGVVRYGPLGFFAGLLTGAVGVVARPLGGCFECAGKTSQAVGFAALGKEGYFGNDTRRVRPPGQFSVSESVPDAAQLLEWKRTLGIFLPRADSDQVKDVIYVQPSVVVLVTDHRIVYMQKYMRRGVVRNWKLRWHIPLHHVMKIQGNGLKLRVDITRRSHSLLLCGMSYLKSYPIDCATTSKFRSLVVRLNRHALPEDSDHVGLEGSPWLEALAHNCEEVTLMHPLDTPLLEGPGTSVCEVEDVPSNVPVPAPSSIPAAGGGATDGEREDPSDAAEEIAPAPPLTL
eukprot:scaffold840_cov344-Pavlova_lutheri.AAC.87